MARWIPTCIWYILYHTRRFLPLLPALASHDYPSLIDFRATITLHNPYLDLANLDSTSTSRCIEAARAILSAYFRLSETSLDISRLHPFVTVSFRAFQAEVIHRLSPDLLVSCCRSSSPGMQALHRNKGWGKRRPRVGGNQRLAVCCHPRV